jgi:hypothetical protein
MPRTAALVEKWQLAVLAARHARRTFTLGANNHPDSNPVADNPVKASRFLLGQLVTYLAPTIITEAKANPQITVRRRLEASLGQVTDKKFQAGNCMEQAMCAYRYLIARPRSNDIHLVTVSMSPYNVNDKHMFVTIGAPRANATLGTLGADVVVCDPWVAEVLGTSPLGRIGAYYADDYYEYVQGAKAGDYANSIEIWLAPL